MTERRRTFDRIVVVQYTTGRPAYCIGPMTAPRAIAKAAQIARAIERNGDDGDVTVVECMPASYRYPS